MKKVTNEANERARYVMTPDGMVWGHIFDDSVGEEKTRFVFDRESQTMVCVLMIGGTAEQGEWWAYASQECFSDLEDSIKNANEEAIENPIDWGLVESDELPPWASSPNRISFGR